MKRPVHSQPTDASRPIPTTPELIASPPPQPIPGKWEWHYRKLLGLREALSAHRKELVQDASQPAPPMGMHLAETASEEFDHEMALSQLSAEQDALYEIENALRRLQNGTYGICELTGQRIPEARLKSVPWTRFARDAEEQLEGQHQVKPRRLGELGTVQTGEETKLGPEPEEPEESAPSQNLPKLEDIPAEEPPPEERPDEDESRQP